MSHSVGVHLTTLQVTTVAGLAGTAGTPDAKGFQDGIGVGNTKFYWPWSLTHDGKLIYVADNYNSAIRTFDPDTLEVKTLMGDPTRVGSRDGSLNTAAARAPIGIVWTPSGLFFTDDGLNIRWIH